MTTVMELMQDAIKYDEPLIAHAVMLGIRHGKWSPSDPESVVDWSLLDLEEVRQARDENILGMSKVQVYSSPLGSNRHAIIFAETSLEAATFFLRAFKHKPRVIHHLPHGMDVTTYESDLKDSQTWREIRNELNTFPAVAGIYLKGVE
ncbi:hypothetical protein [Bhargavaea ginsengi]|uniref:hypothetical protein n=1 Tax=Bhargavaea ginsengi TaxID=426757 RepID=UPI003C73F38B